MKTLALGTFDLLRPFLHKTPPAAGAFFYQPHSLFCNRKDIWSEGGGGGLVDPSPQDATTHYPLGDITTHFHFSQSFLRSPSWTSNITQTMLVYPKFISEGEESTIMKEIEPYLTRLHYEESHWDDAIHSYRETERSQWTKRNETIIQRIRDLAFPPQVPQLKLVHILDLAEKGLIKPHIDSVRFCGNTIAGLSLLSDCVMRLRHDVQKDFSCDIYLPRCSLYVMRNFARYEFTHEILGQAESLFKNEKIPKGRRVSVICRNEPNSGSGTGPVFTPLQSKDQ